MRILSLLLAFTQPTFASSVDLLAYLQAHVDNAAEADASIPHYRRIAQFGAWEHRGGEHPCFNTREAVLARAEDPSVSLTLNKNGCSIVGGEWHDPYTGQTFNKATQVQIDHLVPLKNAYYAGAYNWPAPKRCHYVNFMANNFHLQVVSGHENMSKGDHGPDAYMPPSAAEACPYIYAWIRIKTIWERTSTAAELSAIANVLATCPSEDRVMDDGELEQQRRAAAMPIPACVNFSGEAGS